MPRNGSSSAIISLSVTLLPQPLSPMMTSVSPSVIDREMSRSTNCEPNHCETPAISITGGPVGANSGGGFQLQLVGRLVHGTPPGDGHNT